MQRAIQTIIDILRVIKEQKAGIGELTQDVKDGVDAFANLNGAEQVLRKMVGVGYSGGFVPLVEAMIEEGYNVASLVALGGSTLAIGSLLAKAISGIIEQMEKIATARDQTTRDAYNIVLQILRSVLKTAVAPILLGAVDLFMAQLDGFYDTLDQNNFQQKVQEFYDGLRGLVQQMSGYTWGPIESTHAGLVVNIWGSKDPLAKIGVSGYRSEMGGYSFDSKTRPLFNIEIEGADHYDYINGVYDYTDPQDITRNEIVSKFVAQVILNSETPEQLVAYLAKTSIGVTITRPNPNSYDYIIDFGF